MGIPYFLLRVEVQGNSVGSTSATVPRIQVVLDESLEEDTCKLTFYVTIRTVVLRTGVVAATGNR